jgi:hypothetical protein
LMEIQAWCGTHFPYSLSQRALRSIIAVTASGSPYEVKGFLLPLPVGHFIEMIGDRRLSHKTCEGWISLWELGYVLTFFRWDWI